MNKEIKFSFHNVMALVALTLLLALGVGVMHAQTVIKSPADSFYDFAGIENPFAVTEPDGSIEQAVHITVILCGEHSLGPVLPADCVVVDNSKTWNSSVFGEMPPKAKYSIKVTGAPKPVYASDLAYLLNNDNPERLRIDLNALGIATLGPNPLPLPFGYQFAYVTNYLLDPLALDPGPIPANILAYIANLEKAKRKAVKK